jgi:amino acid transporter
VGKSKISFLAIVLLIVSAIDSNRNLPAAAIFGAPLIFFFLFAAVFFLFPTAFIAAELSAAFPEKGGIYHWVRVAFGEKLGLIAVWLQWINTMVWYPTILSFLAGTGAYLFDPVLMHSKLYMVIGISGIFWTLTLINLFGIHVSAKVNSMFATVGTVFPMLLLIVLGFLWFFWQEPRAIEISAQSIFPSLTRFETWTALEAVMASFLGMELIGVHVGSVDNPQKTFPRAILLASVYILGTMLLGSLMIAVVLPLEKINLAGGLMQVFAGFFHAFGLEKLIFLMSFLIVIGSLGGMINWIISPAKGLLHASEHGFLPKFLSHINKYGAASRILIIQALLVTLFCSAFLLVPTVNAFYWLLTALSNCLYMLMYILMFLAALRLRLRYPSGSFKVPFGFFGLFCVCLLGLIGAVLTIIFGFVPPENIDVGSASRYAAIIGSGIFLLICPAFLLISYKKRRHIGH